MYPNSVLYAVLLFVCYIVLLYLFTIMLLYVILILDCVGYFHRPKKPLIQSHSIEDHRRTTLCSVGKLTAFWSRCVQALYSP